MTDLLITKITFVDFDEDCGLEATFKASDGQIYALYTERPVRLAVGCLVPEGAEVATECSSEDE